MMANQWRPVLFLALFCASCSALRPDPEFQPVTPTAFSHASFGSVLGRFVDDNGRVDYSALQQDSVDLDYYYALIAQVSPDSHPDLFPTNEDKLAYWINAYNATVMSAVVRAYPISEVGDVGIPTMKAGFFLLQNIHIGGARTNLYHLENKVIRRRFPDPRIHFALNCASASCPTLRNRIVLRRQTISIAASTTRRARSSTTRATSVSITNTAPSILSAIFKWYESDFTEWPGKRLPKKASHYSTT